MSSGPDPTTILCVCTGNYCRSPMAEGLLRHYLARRGDGERFQVISAGTTRHHDGQPPAPLVLQALRERGACDFTHRPHHITADEVARADLILVMAAEHRDWIAHAYPEALPRTMLLSEALDQASDIPDPGIQALEPLRATVELIENYVRDGIDVIITRAQARRT